ncbi:hypothetical protein PRUPE_1G370800 [Prunus persica]|uniref:Uncharacterized protein n=1 Tax=Prunus persica TaxID=3760 RepID=A0A251R910_PRUPE|nr:hypothetical protein PRUPE_1G370800 [Prunus persica]
MSIYRSVKLKPSFWSANLNLVRFRCSASLKVKPSANMEAPILTPTHKYAAGALFALALHQSQIHQARPSTPPLPSLEKETISEGASIGKTVSVSDNSDLWIHENSGLIYPVFRFLGVDEQSWKGIKETAGSSSQVRHHVGALMTLLSEGTTDGPSSEKTDKECALTKTVDAMALSEEESSVHSAENPVDSEYEAKCRERYEVPETKPVSEVSAKPYEIIKRTSSQSSTEEKVPDVSESLEEPVEEGNLISYERKVTVLFALLSACVADNTEDGNKCSEVRKGYDARHRVALRLLAAWLGVEWLKMRLAVGILVSGLVFEDEDFIRPWEGQNENLERYALWWESKNLIALSTAIQDWLTSRIALELMKEGAMMTVLNTLLAAFAMPATLVTASDLIDSKWAVAVDRSDKAGKMLAEVLLKGLQGNRPVTLIGFSLGARVVFKCLQCLAETEGDNAGLVERVVLLGAPISIEEENWTDARKMVAGRFVNAYSISDWTLGIAFRASLLSQGLGGIQPVDVPGIENVDVTQLVEGHSSYLWKTKQILEQLELDSYYPVFRTTLKPQEDNSCVN